MYFWLLAVLQVIMMLENKVGRMIKILEVICCKLHRCMVMQRKEMGAHIEPVLVLTLLPLHLSEPPASRTRRT